MTVIDLRLSGKYATVKNNVPDLSNIENFGDIIIPVSAYNGTKDITKYAKTITGQCQSFLGSINVPWTEIKGSKKNKFSDFISITFIAEGDKLKCTLKWIYVKETINKIVEPSPPKKNNKI